MKKNIFSMVLMLMLSIGAMAQSDIVIGTMSPIGNMSDAARNLLEDKMLQMETKNGFGGVGEAIRFVMTCSVDELDKEITSGSPVTTLYKLAFNFTVLDTETGVILATATVTTKGAGENDTKAYMAAIKALRVSDPNVKRMLDKSRQTIDAMLAVPEPEVEPEPAPADTTVAE